jgi:hypothetical protein
MGGRPIVITAISSRGVHAATSMTGRTGCYQVSFRMTQPIRFELYNSPVKAKHGQPGGGVEYSTYDKVHVDPENLHVTPLG